MSDTPAPYHTTLLLDDKGDIQFSGAGKLVMTLTDNLKRSQDINIFIKTVFGDDVFNPNYGFDIRAAKEPPFNPARIEHELRKSITQYMNRTDRPNRIKSINSITVGEPNSERAVQVDINLTSDTNSISVLQTNV